jgi:hypothetical protein
MLYNNQPSFLISIKFAFFQQRQEFVKQAYIAHQANAHFLTEFLYLEIIERLFLVHSHHMLLQVIFRISFKIRF